MDRIESEEKGSGGESGEHLEQNPICLREQVRMQQKGHLKSPDGVFSVFDCFSKLKILRKSGGRTLAPTALFVTFSSNSFPPLTERRLLVWFQDLVLVNSSMEKQTVMCDFQKFVDSV